MEYPIKFIIRDDRTNKSGKCPIYLRYTSKRKFINLPVKQSISPQFWNKEDGKPNRTYPKYRDLKKILDEFEERIIERIEKYLENNKVLPDIKTLKEIISKNTLIQINQGSTSPSLESQFKDYFQYQKKDGMSLATLNIYNYTWEKWSDYEKEQKRSFDYSEINYSILNEFRIFLKNQGLQVNTVSKYIKTIKSFLNYLILHKELEVPASYKKVAVEKEEPEIQVLTQEELETLKREVLFSRNEEHKVRQFNLNEREKLIGQILLFLCHTGLSYVDFDNLKIGNLVFIKDLNGLKGLQIHTSRQKLKTVSTCKIPILDITIDLLIDKIGIPYQFLETVHNEDRNLNLKIKILETYINQQITKGKLNLESRIFPRVISQNFNREIKEVTSKIGITSPVYQSKFFGGKKEENTVPKSDLITTHTGRRTFITRSIENGVSLLVLKDMTGHSKLQTLARYNKNSAEFIQREVKSKTPEQIEFREKEVKEHSNNRNKNINESENLKNKK